MTDPTAQARKLLDAATPGDELAKHSYYELLAVAITLADYAKGQDCETYGPHEECSEVLEIEFALGDYCDRCKALAEWGKLFGDA